MKIMTWNVNGISARVQSGDFGKIMNENADVLCLQELKLSTNKFPVQIPGYQTYINTATKKGYSGTAIISKEEAKSIITDKDIKGIPFETEGRIICAQYSSFFVVTVYAPVATSLERLMKKVEWMTWLRNLVNELNSIKPVILLGDFNIAHRTLDTCLGPNANGAPGCTKLERAALTELINTGYVDTVRAMHPTAQDLYTWWNYKGNARRFNRGWRIDYIFTPKQMFMKVSDCRVISNIYGSDHAPVEVTIND